MFRNLMVVVAAGFIYASAAADVRVFVTSSASGYGLDLLGPQGDGTGTDPGHENWPIDPFRPTYSSVNALGTNSYAYDYYYAYYRVGAYPPINAPSGTVENPILIDASAGEWAYIWFQFRDEPYGAHVNGLEVAGTPAGVPPVDANVTAELEYTYYLQNDEDNPGLPGMQVKRWDGTATAPVYPEWHQNPQTLVSVTAAGISNGGEWPEQLFDQQANNGALRTGVGLLGAIRGPASDRVYEYQIANIGYQTPGPFPSLGKTYFKLVPEPATTVTLLLILGFARRR